MLEQRLRSPVPILQNENWLGRTRLSPGSLSVRERDELGAAAQWMPSTAANFDVIREGEAAAPLCVLLEGWAYRYRTMRDGKRQITKVLLPGDVINLCALLSDRMDFGVRSLTETHIVPIRAARFRSLCDQHAGIMRLAMRLAIAETSVAQCWSLVLGRYSAAKRVAHLLCELSVRIAGNNDGVDSFDMPLTQEQIGDVLGLTGVHVNRVMKRLREEGLIETEGRSMTLLNPPGLRRLAEFSPAYLQLEAQA